MQSEYAINNQKLPDRQYKGEELYEKIKKQTELKEQKWGKKNNNKEFLYQYYTTQHSPIYLKLSVKR